MFTWMLDHWHDPDPDRFGIEDLAQKVGLSEDQVRNWVKTNRSRYWNKCWKYGLAMPQPFQGYLDEYGIGSFEDFSKRIQKEQPEVVLEPERRVCFPVHRTHSLDGLLYA